MEDREPLPRVVKNKDGCISNGLLERRGFEARADVLLRRCVFAGRRQKQNGVTREEHRSDCMMEDEGECGWNR